MERFTKFFKERNLLEGNFLAAVSGGIDSAVLCELCKQSGLDFAMAHCNFQLRGEESERDEQFVQALSDKYGVQLFLKRFNTSAYAEEKKISIQEAARELRYDWFTQLRIEKGISFTVLAHHADDNIETLLMNFFRGTGLQGLTGMPTEDLGSRFILRPLLELRRTEIVEFAQAHNLKWVEDSSNASSKYTRNFFRNELLPAIKNRYPAVEDNLIATIQRLKKANALYTIGLEEIKKKLCFRRGSEVLIPVLKLQKYEHTSLIYEIIKDYGFGEKQVEEVLKLAKADSGKFIENDRYQVIKHRNWLVIAQVNNVTDTIAIEKGRERVNYAGGQLHLKTISKESFRLQKKEAIAQLDTRKIEYPLLLRKWKKGDYFYPLGMPKKKKLARFFIDLKLPKNQKENIWVLESNNRILWIVGIRIDDRFKVTDSSREVLVVTNQGEVSAR
ncbi:MAG: tRNA lysidine(34) synthetase TilS [Flavisolibacter sp.]